MVGTYDERPWVIPLAKVTASFGLVTYVVARLLLLLLASSYLRKLGPKAYLEVDWTRYLLHLGSGCRVIVAPKINVRSTITPIDKGQITLALLDLDNVRWPRATRLSFHRERSHALVAHGFGSPGSDYP